MKRLGYLMVMLLFGFVMVSSIYAQQATVMGKVTRSDGTPLIKAVVAIGEKYSYTDVKGRYRIKAVPFGVHTIQIKQGDQVLKEEKIKINQDQVTLDVTVP